VRVGGLGWIYGTTGVAITTVVSATALSVIVNTTTTTTSTIETGLRERARDITGDEVGETWGRQGGMEGGRGGEDRRRWGHPSSRTMGMMRVWEKPRCLWVMLPTECWLHVDGLLKIDRYLL
jgi:hypothetical protein